MSGSLPLTLKFEVPGHSDELLDFVKSILNDISAHKAIGTACQQRMKLILTELVTNTIKHANACPSHLELIIEESKLIIKKKEIGAALKFLYGDQMPFRVFGQVKEISFSPENTHYIQTLDSYSFKFLDPFSSGLLSEGIPEHFGLYIITLAADSFFYEYDSNLSENRYIVCVIEQVLK